MVELATTPADSGKAQMHQLLALRYLAERADALKKDARYADHRQVLEDIAGGKKALDRQGFSERTAQAVLRRLDGSQKTASVRPPLKDGLTWFPGEATLVACIDFRHVVAGKDP